MALACVVASLFLIPGAPAAAEPADDARPNPRAAGAATAADPRVSMSPEADVFPPPLAPAALTPTAESADAHPLTRAAARRRMEATSPIPWLARYGPVSLERHE